MEIQDWILSPPSLPSAQPHYTHTHTHTLTPSWTARGQSHSRRTHNTDELQRLLFRDTLPPSDRRPSLPAPPDTCELLQTQESDWSQPSACDITGSIQNLHLNSVAMAVAPISAVRWADNCACRDWSFWAFVHLYDFEVKITSTAGLICAKKEDICIFKF